MDETDNISEEGLTREEREDEFLRLLNTGCTVRQAAAAVKISYVTFYRRRAADPEFAKRWEDAQRIGLQQLIEEAERRAMNGSDKLLMFLLSSYDPQRFSPTKRLEVSNPDGSLALSETDKAARVASLLERAKQRKDNSDLI